MLMHVPEPIAEDETSTPRERSAPSRTSSQEVHRIRRVYAERELTHAEIERADRVNPGYQQLVRECFDRLERVLSERFARSLSQCRILDLGCGSGHVLRWFHERGALPANLVGIDLLPARITIARQNFPDFIFLEGNAESIDLPDQSFDLVAVLTVFSSILDWGMAHNVARTIRRLLKRGGAVVWYDMRFPNPWNRNLRAMTRPRIRELFPSFALELESVSLLPPLARRLGPLTGKAYPVLASVPLLRSHYLGLLRPAR